MGPIYSSRCGHVQFRCVLVSKLQDGCGQSKLNAELKQRSEEAVFGLYEEND